MKSTDDKLLREHHELGHLPVVKKDYGWVISVGRFYDPEDAAQFEQDLRENYGFSDAFISLLRYAAANQCWNVEFDRDADPEPGFEIYDWEANDLVINEEAFEAPRMVG